MCKMPTLKSITIEYREYARYLHNNPLQEKTENAQDTIQKTTENARDTNVTIRYKRKQRMRKILT